MSAERSDARHRLFNRGDAIGLLLAAALATWLISNAVFFGGSAVRPVGVILASAVAFALARFIGARWWWVPAVGVVVAVSILVVPGWSELVRDDPLAGPLEYQNANGALLLQALVAVATIVVVTVSDTARIGLTIVVVVIGTATILTGSTAAVLLSLGVGAMAALVVLGWCRAWMANALAVTLLVAITATIVIGATYVKPEKGFVQTSLTPTRFALWHDAVTLTASDPWTGIGLGRFSQMSSAAADPDVGHAHQEFLELAAETGVLGGLLLVGVFVWTVLRIGTGAGPTAPIAAVGVTALGVHASVDFVLHFPIIPIAAAVLAGAASVGREPTNPSTAPARISAS